MAATLFNTVALYFYYKKGPHEKAYLKIMIQIMCVSYSETKTW